MKVIRVNRHLKNEEVKTSNIGIAIFTILFFWLYPILALLEFAEFRHGYWITEKEYARRKMEYWVKRYSDLIEEKQ